MYRNTRTQADRKRIRRVYIIALLSNPFSPQPQY